MLYLNIFYASGWMEYIYAKVLFCASAFFLTFPFFPYLLIQQKKSGTGNIYKDVERHMETAT